MTPAELRVHEVAAGYERGWSYVPLNGKKPTEKNWTARPRETLEQAIEWAESGNVGVRTGRVSGLIVMDLDPGADTAGLALPPTVTVLTGRDGARHLYYKSNGAAIGNSAGKLAPHIDVRGDGGQVVAVGSIHPDTKRPYLWAPGCSPRETDFAELPAEIVAKLQTPLERCIARLAALPDAVEGERGHDRTFNAACEVVRCGLARDEEMKAFRWFNAEKCDPPWSETELEHKLNDARKVEHAKPVVTPPTFRFITPSELKQRPNQTFIIESLIPKAGMVVLYGRRGCGKTFVVLGQALAIATGQAWLNHETEPGRVIYVATEGLAGYKKRLEVWEYYHGIAVPDETFSFVADGLNLLNDGVVLAFIKGVPMSPSLIVVDTLARCLIGGDENSAGDMGRAVANVDLIREKTGAAVVLVHHQGRGETGNPRGSSALDGAADMLIRVENEIGAPDLDLLCEKSKDSEPFTAIHLVRETVQMPDGGPSSCIIRQSQHGWNGLSDSQARALNSLKESQIGDGLSKTDWKDASGLPKTTFYRTVNELLKRGYVQQHGKGNLLKFSVGQTESPNECQ